HGDASPAALGKPKKIRPEFRFGNNHEFWTQSSEVWPDREGEVQGEIKHFLRAEPASGEFLPGAGGRRNHYAMGGEFLLQRLYDCARSHHLAHRNRVNPDCGFLAATSDGGRNRAEPLAQTRPILAVPHHLQQPVGQRQHQKENEQRTVERIHEEKSHSKWRAKIRSSLRIFARDEAARIALTASK